MIAVKVKLPSNDEIRRFSLSSTSTFEELTAKLSQFGINLASGQHKLTYLDDEEDQVSLRSDEELTEAINLARSVNPGILHLTIKNAPKKAFVPQESIPEPQENSCPFSSGRWVPGHGRRGSRGGHCSFARPGCIAAAVLGAVVIFKILSFLSYFLGIWAFIGLGFLGFRFLMRRRCMRRMAEAGVAPAASGCPFSQRRPCFSFPVHPAQNIRVTETEPSPQPTSSASSTSSSAPQTQSASTPLSQSGNSENVKNKFETLLNSLFEMGFTDRALNIEKLVANRLNLSATIQSLLQN